MFFCFCLFVGLSFCRSVVRITLKVADEFKYKILETDRPSDKNHDLYVGFVSDTVYVCVAVRV